MHNQLPTVAPIKVTKVELVQTDLVDVVIETLTQIVMNPAV